MTLQGVADIYVIQVIDLHISPAIYRLVCKQFHDLKDHQGSWESLYDIGLWIDCWVGCASVIVRNKRRVSPSEDMFRYTSHITAGLVALFQPWSTVMAKHLRLELAPSCWLTLHVQTTTSRPHGISCELCIMGVL